MRELVVILALLARSWRVIDRIYQQRCAVPSDVGNEFQALIKDLTSFFTDPLGQLGPLMAQAMEVSPAVAEVEPVAPVAEPIDLNPRAVICDACNGKGYLKSRYMGVKGDNCPVCDTARMVYPGDVPIPAWGAPGADWYSKDQQFAPTGFADKWVNAKGGVIKG